MGARIISLTSELPASADTTITTLWVLRGLRVSRSSLYYQQLPRGFSVYVTIVIYISMPLKTSLLKEIPQAAPSMASTYP